MEPEKGGERKKIVGESPFGKGDTDPEDDRRALERRVAQLFGERDALRRQVSDLLAKNAQAQKDLGAAAERHRGAEKQRLKDWPTTLWRAVEKVRRADVGGLLKLRRKTEPSPSPRPARSNRSPGALIPFRDAEGGPRPVLGVTLMGVDGAALPGILDIIARESEAKGLTPVIVTDTSDFAPFRARRLIVEYVPPQAARQRFAPDLPWDLYLGRRLALFRQKWAPVAIVSYGRPPVEWPELVGGAVTPESPSAG